MLARKLIADWCHIIPENIKFDTNKYGKPYAINLNVEFNISHSGNIVICAIDNKPVGIDIEQIRPIDLKIAKRICSENELRYLFGYPPKETDFNKTDDTAVLSRFFELWTAKEAYSKCLGNGLCFIDTQTIEYDSFFFYHHYIVSIYSYRDPEPR